MKGGVHTIKMKKLFTGFKLSSDIRDIVDIGKLKTTKFYKDKHRSAQALIDDIFSNIGVEDILTKVENKEYGQDVTFNGDVEENVTNIRKILKTRKEAQTQQTTEQPGSSSEQSNSSSKTTVAELFKMIKDVDGEMKPLVKESTETVSKISRYIAKLTEKFKSGNIDTQKTIKDLREKNKGLTDDKTALQNKINEMAEQTNKTTSKIEEKEYEIKELKVKFDSEKKKLDDKVKEQQKANQLIMEEKVTTVQNHAEKIEKIQNNIANLRTEKLQLQQQLQKQNEKLAQLNKDLTNVKAIKDVIDQITEKTQALGKNINDINQTINEQEGGYQYKSKSRSRRKYKGNRFGLLKSKSKTRKGKKKKKKKNKNIKGGMKTRTKSKRKSKKGKKTRKGKKKNNKRK